MSNQRIWAAARASAKYAVASPRRESAMLMQPRTSAFCSQVDRGQGFHEGRSCTTWSAGSLIPQHGPGSTVYHPFQQQQRRFSSYTFDSFGSRFGGGGGSSSMLSTVWPLTKANTIFNIVPQGYVHVIERFGKLHAIQQSGWFIAIPIVDQISYIIDLRERAMVSCGST
jgi:hypothetical protein